MLRKTLVTLAEPQGLADPAPDSRAARPLVSSGDAFNTLAVDRLHMRIHEVTMVSFTRLEMRQVLTALERLEQSDEHDRAFDMLREKLKTELGRRAN